jgi:polysaccharide biosynthesis/export protein
MNHNKRTWPLGFHSLPFMPLIAAFSLLVLLDTSCSPPRKLAYFEGAQETGIKSKDLNIDPVIQRNDIVSITVSSLNPEASSIFNAPNLSNPSSNAAFNNVVGYLVSTEGSITFPVIGAIHAEGMTKTQLSKFITSQLIDRKLLVDPIVTIRNLNFKVSVLGEVSRPGVFPIASEKVNIMEALGLAGDITIYGKKDNVMLIREDGKGEKLVKMLDLNSPDVLSSPYYYLKSNDIVYVEPLKDRVKKERNAQIMPIIFSLVSLTIVLLDRIKIK